jgi:hypothetical protein
MDIRVFNISINIEEKTLLPIDIENIDKVFNKIFSPSNTDHIQIGCFANDNSILKQFQTNPNSFDLSIIAEKLRIAELKNDGTRNQQITEGYLFIKKINKSLWLLKLENIEVVDIDKNFEMKPSFSTESNYYKGCILDSDPNKVIIIDKNRSVAKYWREGFLDLSLIRDDFINTSDLILLLKEDRLFTPSIISSDKYKTIKSIVEEYIFSIDSFDKVDLSNTLKSKKLISEKTLDSIFSEESKIIDSEFILSDKALRDEYRKVIYISEGTKIVTDNFSKLFQRQRIEYQDGKITLSLDDEFINRLPEELKHEN